MIYIGIDNGLSGALVALSDSPGLPPIASTVMPLQSRTKGHEVDIRGVVGWINSVTGFNREHCCIVIETPGKHSPGVHALCSMWDSFGRLCALCELKGLRHFRVQPQAWQKVMLPGCEKGQTKPHALAVAHRLWPYESWIATPKGRKPHAGVIDAALIAEYARRTGL